MTLRIFPKNLIRLNRAYLEELNHEYDITVTGENEEDVFGSLFVPADEISRELEKSNLILMDYPTGNRAAFAIAVDE